MNTKDNQEAEREAFEKLIIPVLNNLPISETKYQYALNSIKTAFDMMTTLTTPQVNEEVASGEAVATLKKTTKVVYNPKATEVKVQEVDYHLDHKSLPDGEYKLYLRPPTPSQDVLVEALQVIANGKLIAAGCRNVAKLALATYSASTDSVSISRSEISEQRIIELAVESNKKCNSTGNKCESNTVNKDWLLQFANALQAEWIKSLGEPKAYAAFSDNGNIRIWTCKKGESKRLSEQIGEELEALYALPNEEVK